MITQVYFFLYQKDKCPEKISHTETECGRMHLPQHGCAICKQKDSNNWNTLNVPLLEYDINSSSRSEGNKTFLKLILSKPSKYNLKSSYHPSSHKISSFSSEEKSHEQASETVLRLICNKHQKTLTRLSYHSR